MRLGLYHVYEGSTVVQGPLDAVCSRKAFVAPVNIWQRPKRRVLHVSHMQRVNMPHGSMNFCASNNNLRQIPDVKPGLATRISRPSLETLAQSY